MIKKLTLIVSMLCCVHAYSKEDWKLVWADEFEYEGNPDPAKWSFDTEGNNWDWGNDEAQNYTPAEKKNAWVSDGNLTIEARKETYTWPGDGQTKQYTSARLRTLGKGDWTYGKVEVRAQLPTGRGMWPAIWMLPSDNIYGEWPNSGELDIMENVGFDPDKIHCNIHTGAYNHKMGTNKGNTVTAPSAPSQDYHLYSMIWDAEKVIFYFDNEQVFRFDNEHKSFKEWPYDQKFHLLLNIAVGGGWGGEQGIDDNIFPQRMLVDYVRVYQMSEVEEKDAVLSLNVSTPADVICQGEKVVLKVDTTGTGIILQPDKYEIEVLEKTNGTTQRVSELHKSIQEGNMVYTLQPDTNATRITYKVNIKYREGEGEFEQMVSDSVEITTVRPLQYTIPELPALCGGEELEFVVAVENATNYSFVDNPDIINTYGNQLTIRPTFDATEGNVMTKVYECYLRNDGCPSLHIEIPVIVHRPLSGSIAGPTYVCEDDVAVLDASSYNADTYEWTSLDSYSQISQEATVIDTIHYYSQAYMVNMTRGACTAEEVYKVAASSRPSILSIDSIDVLTVECIVEEWSGTYPLEFRIDTEEYQTSGTLTANTFGLHTISVRDAIGCASTIEFYIINPENNHVTAVGSSNKATIYPTIATNELNIADVKEGTPFSICSANGAQLLSGKVSEDKAVDIRSLQNGYFLLIIGNKAYPFIKE